jgi:histidyl-tRNA synthetase
LLFKILNSRIHENKNKELLFNEFAQSLDKAKNSEILTERALRYDLTVPFARYVVMHQNEIHFPFKRFQIQPVWRADKPQKGRYREFFQCDADIIGSNSLINEIELIRLMDDVFHSLRIPVIIKMNNRKILAGIAQIAGESERIVDITVAIDKLDKIGKDKVNEELKSKGIPDEAIEKIQPLFDFKGNNAEKFKLLENYLKNSETGMKGFYELKYVFDTIESLKLKHAVLELDITLARGLNYYTGSIFEVKANANSISSSICGGGRYDDLTGIFGLKGLSGVGISFGIDRIFDVINDLGLYTESSKSSLQLLFVNFGETETKEVLKLLPHLRQMNISCDIYPDASKIKKQMEYADKKKIPFVCMAGSQEIEKRQWILKNMQSGTQVTCAPEDIAQHLKE